MPETAQEKESKSAADKAKAVEKDRQTEREKAAGDAKLKKHQDAVAYREGKLQLNKTHVIDGVDIVILAFPAGSVNPGERFAVLDAEDNETDALVVQDVGGKTVTFDHLRGLTAQDLVKLYGQPAMIPLFNKLKDLAATPLNLAHKIADALVQSGAVGVGQPDAEGHSAVIRVEHADGGKSTVTVGGRSDKPILYAKAGSPDLTVKNETEREKAIADGYVPAEVESPERHDKRIETVQYADGSSATGVAPLPRVSPSGSPAI
jgi:hypothetical protein